jgi:hypothetical protein
MVPLNALGDVFADLGELGAAAGRQEVAQAGQRAGAAGAREIPRRVRVCPKTSGGITKFSEHEAD